MSTAHIDPNGMDTSLPAANTISLQPASIDIWDMKYRLKSKSGGVIDKDVEATYRRVARALWCVVHVLRRQQGGQRGGRRQRCRRRRRRRQHGLQGVGLERVLAAHHSIECNAVAAASTNACACQR